MLRCILTFLLLVLATSIVRAGILDVYIGMGQSNLVGGAWTPYPPAPYDAPQDSRYWYSLGAGPGVFQSNGWEQVRTLWPSYPYNVSFGAEITLAAELQERTGQRVAILKAGWNGTGLHTHWRPEANNLYPWSLERIQAGLATLDEPYRVAGLFWIQGESDAGWDYWANQYAANLTSLVNQLRLDLNAPEMPVALNLLHPQVQSPAVEIVRQQQLAFVAADPYALCFDPSDIPLGPDLLHYPNESFLELGRRFADLFMPPTPFAPADFNHNGQVGPNDLALWRQSYGIDNLADANGDGVTDGSDFLAWQQQSNMAPPVTAVPEPTALVVILWLCPMFRRNYV